MQLCKIDSKFLSDLMMRLPCRDSTAPQRHPEMAAQWRHREAGSGGDPGPRTQTPGGVHHGREGEGLPQDHPCLPGERSAD